MSPGAQDAERPDAYRLVKQLLTGGIELTTAPHDSPKKAWFRTVIQADGDVMFFVKREAFVVHAGSAVYEDTLQSHCRTLRAYFDALASFAERARSWLRRGTWLLVSLATLVTSPLVFLGHGVASLAVALAWALVTYSFRAYFRYGLRLWLQLSLRSARDR